MLNSLIYLSKESIEFTVPSLKKLSNTSDERNRQLNITGFLSWKDGFFYQYLEGEQDRIDELYDKIKNDTRHEILYFLSFSNKHHRIFNDWGMKYYMFDEQVNFDHDALIRSILEVLSYGINIEANLETDLLENLKYIRKNFTPTL